MRVDANLGRYSFETKIHSLFMCLKMSTYSSGSQPRIVTVGFAQLRLGANGAGSRLCPPSDLFEALQ
jgi:hypothetical protein